MPLVNIVCSSRLLYVTNVMAVHFELLYRGLSKAQVLENPLWGNKQVMAHQGLDTIWQRWHVVGSAANPKPERHGRC